MRRPPGHGPGDRRDRGDQATLALGDPPTQSQPRVRLPLTEPLPSPAPPGSSSAPRVGPGHRPQREQALPPSLLLNDVPENHLSPARKARHGDVITATEAPTRPRTAAAWSPRERSWGQEPGSPPGSGSSSRDRRGCCAPTKGRGTCPYAWSGLLGSGPHGKEPKPHRQGRRHPVPGPREIHWEDTRHVCACVYVCIYVCVRACAPLVSCVWMRDSGLADPCPLCWASLGALHRTRAAASWALFRPAWRCSDGLLTLVF